MAASALLPVADPARPQWTARLFLAVVAFGLFVPALALPLREDDFATLYWARASLLDPRYLFQDWYGGALGRLIPKLLVMLGMTVVGPRPAGYELVNVLLHVANVLLLERLARALSGSRRVGFLSALLFALGLGFYGKAVLKISNLAMNLGLTLTLCLLVEWQARRRWRALLLWLLTLATHEITALAPLAMLLAPVDGANVRPGPERWRTGLALGGLAVAVLASRFGGPAHGAAAYLVSYPGFVLVPVNLSTALELRSAGVWLPLDILRSLDAHRVGLGLASLPLVAFALTRGPVPRLAVAWMYLSWLPAAIFMATWGSFWLDARYLMAPAVGLCVLVAVLLDRLPTRRLRRLLLAGLITWSLALLAFVWLVTCYHAGGTYRQRRYREFCVVLAELERTHVPVRGPAWPRLRPPR